MGGVDIGIGLVVVGMADVEGAVEGAVVLHPVTLL